MKNCPQSVTFRHNSGSMTAIVWQYIPQGFVIGADGRRRVAGGLIETENAQKIYSVKLLEQGLVYAWSGTTDRTDRIPISLKFLTDCVLESINAPSLASFADFMNIFAEKLHPLLLAFIGRAVRSFKSAEIAQAVFLAYFKGSHYVGEVRVKHNGSVVLRPEVIYYSPPPKFEVFSGSKLVFDKMKDKILLEPKSLEAASTLVKEYVEECMKYQNIDADCANIGGRIHIGELTVRGFSWVEPPILS